MKRLTREEIVKRRERAFWRFVEKNAREVDKWPQWMKGGEGARELAAAKQKKGAKR